MYTSANKKQTVNHKPLIHKQKTLDNKIGAITKIPKNPFTKSSLTVTQLSRRLLGRSIFCSAREFAPYCEPPHLNDNSGALLTIKIIADGLFYYTLYCVRIPTQGIAIKKIVFLTNVASIPKT